MNTATAQGLEAQNTVHDFHGHAEIDEHELKYALYKRLHKYYEKSDYGYVHKFADFALKKVFRLKPYDHQINMDNYVHKKAEDVTSEQARVNRTIFALKKIKEFNPEFFSYDE